jgi:hypothetical protein
LRRPGRPCSGHDILHDIARVGIDEADKIAPQIQIMTKP